MGVHKILIIQIQDKGRFIYVAPLKTLLPNETLMWIKINIEYTFNEPFMFTVICIFTYFKLILTENSENWTLIPSHTCQEQSVNLTLLQ